MGKVLSNVPYYNQRYANYNNLCTYDRDFDKYGCGICCAAMIVQYKEGGTKDPGVMQQRGVWTRSNLTTMWSNAFRNGNRFSMNNEYSGNLSGALKEIKNQIDKYSDPMVVRIANGSWEHFVVAYGYNNNCGSAYDVLIRDPYHNMSTLGQALQTWPTFKFVRRIL